MLPYPLYARVNVLTVYVAIPYKVNSIQLEFL